MATLQAGEKARMYALGKIMRGGASRGGYVSSQVFITIDGVQVLDTVVPVPPKALIGFSGATGGVTDAHAVNDVRLAY